MPCVSVKVVEGHLSTPAPVTKTRRWGNLSTGKCFSQFCGLEVHSHSTRWIQCLVKVVPCLISGALLPGPPIGGRGQGFLCMCMVLHVTYVYVCCMPHVCMWCVCGMHAVFMSVAFIYVLYACGIRVVYMCCVLYACGVYVCDVFVFSVCTWRICK